MGKQVVVFIGITILCIISHISFAHHVLGRPSYGLDESSNTPPSMQVESQIGNYLVTMMVYPAFPKAHEQGRIHFYAVCLDNGVSFPGTVLFKVVDNSWFSSKEEVLGTQEPNDNIFRQGFVFAEDGQYLIVAEFAADGQPYIIDFPMRVGAPAPFGVIGITVFLLAFILIVVKWLSRKRLQHIGAAKPD